MSEGSEKVTPRGGSGSPSTLEYLRSLQNKVAELEESLAAKEVEMESRSWSPAGGEEGKRVQGGLWLEERTNPRGGQVEEEEKGRLQREEAWLAFCRKARRELTPRELESVTYGTLKKLLALYGFDAKPVEAARIELYWQELHGLRVPKPGTEPYYQFLTQHTPPPRKQATPSPSPAPREPRVLKTPPKPRIPDPYVDPKPKRTGIEHPDPDNTVATCIKQRWVQGIEGAPSPHRTPSPRSYMNPDTIGEKQVAARVRRKDAPTGTADPNRIPDIKAKFFKHNEGSIQAITMREMELHTGNGGLVSKGHKRKAPPGQGRVREVEGKAMVGGRMPPAGSDPNVNPGLSTELDLSPRGLLVKRSRSLPAFSNPNEAGSASILGLTVASRGASPLAVARQQNKVRGRIVKDLGIAASDPNRAGQDDKAAGAVRKAASALYMPAASDPNLNIGWEGEERRMRTKTIEKAVGDRHFAGMPPSTTSNNNISHIEAGVATGPPTLPKSFLFNSPHNRTTHEEQRFLHGNRKLRSATPPGTRTGDSMHPIHGCDGSPKVARRPVPSPVTGGSEAQSRKKQFSNTFHHQSQLTGAVVAPVQPKTSSVQHF